VIRQLLLRSRDVVLRERVRDTHPQANTTRTVTRSTRRAAPDTAG
jgi:hypothetical protein